MEHGAAKQSSAARQQAYARLGVSLVTPVSLFTVGNFRVGDDRASQGLLEPESRTAAMKVRKGRYAMWRCGLWHRPGKGRQA